MSDVVSLDAGLDPMGPIARQKHAAADRAVDEVRSGMVVGLGAGSTAYFAVTRIAERITAGQLLDITGVACARDVGERAARLGIRMSTLDAHPRVDLTIDGADEVDGALDLIKGAGGALLYEKMVAQASRREIIIVDASKPSPMLGTRRALPIEVVEFGWRAQLGYLESLGGHAQLRSGVGNEPFRTDAGHFILDCAFGPISEPRDLAAKLEARAGIVEHGLFVGLATEIFVGTSDGVRHLSRPDHPVQR